MRNKINIKDVLLIIGSALLILSAVFFIISSCAVNRLNIDCEGIVNFIDNIVPFSGAGVKEERYNSEMPSLSFNGQDYVALLSIPRFSVILPIRSCWDKKIVNAVPCRFSGSIYDGTLIIGGIDSDSQFGFVSQIDIGDTVKVKDIRGYEFKYTVVNVKHAKNSSAETLIDEQYDLTLFAKERGSGVWLLVRCKMQ